jgi:hypothetical protein
VSTAIAARQRIEVAYRAAAPPARRAALLISK